MRSIKILALLMSMLVQGYVFAEDVKKIREIHGYVVSNTEPVAYATILINGTTIGAATDANGHFHLHNIPSGDLTLVVSAVGYKSVSHAVDVAEELDDKLEIELQESLITTDEVVVSASRNAVKRKDAPVLVNTIGTKMLESVQASSLADGLNFTPGLRVENDCQNCGFTQVRLNGLEGSYSQVLINSRPILSTMAGVYGLEQIPVNMIDKIEVVRGGGSALFGSNAIGGTINVITKDPLVNSYAIESNFAMINGEAPEFNLNASTSIVSDDYKSGMFLYGGIKRRDHWDANEDGFSEITEINANHLGLRAFYRPGDYSKINLDFGATKEFRRGGNNFDYKADMADIAEQLNHDIISGGLTFDQYSKDSKNKFSAYASGQYIDRDSYYGAEQDPAGYGKTYDYSAVAGLQETYYFDRLLFAPSTLTAGAEFIYGSLNDNKLGFYNQDSSRMEDNMNIADQYTTTLAAYLQNEWDFDIIKFLVGVRYDQIAVEDRVHSDIEKEVYPNWSPRVNLVYKPSEHLSVRANFSTGFRAPQIYSEDLHIEASAARKVIHINDPDLEAEHSWSLTGGFDYDLDFKSSALEIILEGFYTKLDNPFSSEYLWDEDEKILTDIRVNAEDGAIVSGVNLEVNYAFNNKMDLQSGFTVQSSEFESAQAWGELDESVSKHMTRTPSNYGYLVYSYYPTKKFMANVNMNYTGSMYVPHLETQETPEELVKTQEFLDIGVKLAYTFKLSGQTNLELSGGVKNIFNSYQDDFDTGVYRDAGYVYGPGLPRTYFIGLKISNI
ncbi:TonB-dependent receptor [Lentimicrobium sp. L6]|uniref:TonB-dependent receptor n=1 Tax=Lentimicrobium sp. L6 TaxID=2735916 RepID=UPI001553697E|nr:TonB-dependent receptor [Lentimicrobium sp. L6]NPD84725.1 TonB-dependent receptor [Lentimicrobium sp. L6]